MKRKEPSETYQNNSKTPILEIMVLSNDSSDSSKKKKKRKKKKKKSAVPVPPSLQLRKETDKQADEVIVGDPVAGATQ